MFTNCDLTNILVSIWMDDDPFFIHECNRVQMTFALLLYCIAIQVPGWLIGDSKISTRMSFPDRLYGFRYIGGRWQAEVELYEVESILKKSIGYTGLSARTRRFLAYAP